LNKTTQPVLGKFPTKVKFSITISNSVVIPPTIFWTRNPLEEWLFC
jgi:hypothetical protein